MSGLQKNIDSSQIHCLYIEPDEKTVDLIKDHFKAWVSHLEVMILHTSDLNSALQALNSESFDIIITDIEFPNSNQSPVEIIKSIQKHSKKTPVVAIYENPDRNIQQDLFSAGVQECINLASALMQPEIIKHRIISFISQIYKQKKVMIQANHSINILTQLNDSNKQSLVTNLDEALEVISTNLDTIKDEYNAILKKNKTITNAFGMYVDPKIIEKVTAGEKVQAEKGVRQDITILFSDLRGYTRMSANMDSEDIVSFLNEYYTAMTEVVMGFNGMVDKYIGDGIMCIFGAPVKDENHVINAIEAAIEMQSIFELWQKTWKKSYNINPGQGIGLACGETVVGTLGSFQKVSYTAIGAPVNLAARLESVAECGDIVISGEMHDRMEKSGNNNYNFEALSSIAIRGMNGRHSIYRLTKEIDLDEIIVEKN